jgi:lipoprotein-releasing system ATP-binding protein
MPDQPNLLELKDIRKSYADNSSLPPVEVLRGVSLTLQPSQAMAILGPSGSGKSTLLNIIAAIDKPTSGQVLLDGRDLAEMSDDSLAGIRAMQVGLVFQLHHLLPQCTLLENVLLPAMANPDRPAWDAIRQRAVELLNRVGLGDRLAHRPGELSGGQCQRAAVVRALINKPRLLLADEPAGSLDHSSADGLSDLLAELNREEGVSLIVVSHSLRFVRRMGKMFELDNGILSELPGLA